VAALFPKPVIDFIIGAKVMILGENEVCWKRSYLILNFIILRSIKKKQLGLDFLVEKLTNSLKNVATKDRFPTDVTLVASTRF